jgi:hypothetical protein
MGEMGRRIRGLCAIAQAESLSYKLLYGLANRIRDISI